jgi:sulfur carrier protein
MTNHEPGAAGAHASININVSVNGARHAALAGATLADLLGALGHAPERFATAVNGEFVARDKRGGHVLRDGDQVSCFQAIVGG